MDPSALLSLPARAWDTFLALLCSFAPSFYRRLRSQIASRAPSPWPALTQPHLARVGQVVVAGHIAPLSLVMPHHDHAVLSGQEVAVRLSRVPVLIELGGGDGGGSEALQSRSLRGMDLEELWRDRVMGTGREDRGAQGWGGAGRGKRHGKRKEPENGEGGLGHWGWRQKCLEERPRQREGWRESLTRGTPSDHRKSPSMVLSLSPIHWYSRYRSGEEARGRRYAVSSAASRWRPFPGIQRPAGEFFPPPKLCAALPPARGPMEGRDVVGEAGRKISPGLEKENSRKRVKTLNEGQSQGKQMGGQGGGSDGRWPLSHRQADAGAFPARTSVFPA